MKRNWKEWAIAAGLRALRTVAQTAIATIGTSALISEVNWIVVASSAGLSVFMSLLDGLVGKTIVPFCGICLSFALVGALDGQQPLQLQAGV